jgi:DNA polymerase III gamma/tau subunit
MTQKLAEALSYRISDILEYSDFSLDFAKMIGKNNFDVIKDIMTLHLHDFGIFIEIEPDEEQRQLLEQNIQQSIQSGQIGLEDAIDIRSINNITLANSMLKIRKNKKEKLDLEKQQKTIQMQTQANQQSAQSASQSRMQEEQFKNQASAQLEQMRAQLEMQKMQAKKEIDAELLQMKHQFDMELKQMESQVFQSREAYKEDRKDERTKKQATQQSTMIEQRQKDLPPTNFEGADDTGSLMQNIQAMMGQRNM